MTTEMVQEFLDRLRDDDGLSASSVNYYRTILNSIFHTGPSVLLMQGMPGDVVRKIGTPVPRAGALPASLARGGVGRR
jgi:hypothetical protein